MNEKKSIKYKCVKCGITAIVVEGNIIRPCKHDDAGVTADLSATAYGQSHFNKDQVK